MDGWGSLTLLIFANVLLRRLRAECRAIKLAGSLGSLSARRLVRCIGWSRPAALLLARWAVTSRRRFRASMQPGYRSRRFQCVGWLPSLAGVD